VPKTGLEKIALVRTLAEARGGDEFQMHCAAAKTHAV
jgi:hypothetical protein